MYCTNIDLQISIVNSYCVCIFRVLLVWLEFLVALVFKDSLVCLELEEIVVHLVVLVEL